MPVVYDPEAILNSVASRKKIKKIISRGLNLNRTALAFAEAFEFLDKKNITEIALRVIKAYKNRLNAVPEEKKAGLKKSLATNPKLLINRIQNEVLTQLSGNIKNKYQGEFGEWLPSYAEEPDPEHQLNYGKIFQIGVGEMPGERFGCKCGIRILVDDERLQLN